MDGLLQLSIIYNLLIKTATKIFLLEYVVVFVRMDHFTAPMLLGGLKITFNNMVYYIHYASRYICQYTIGCWFIVITKYSAYRIQ